MYTYINANGLAIDNECRQKLEKLYQFYMQHEFDLLGSGFVRVGYGCGVKGFLGKRYVDNFKKLYGRYAKEKIEHECTDTYIPINWFIDYKSGFFFSPLTYTTVKRCYKVMDKKEGVDIKCPWELGRLYHLLQLSVLAIADETLRESIISEFRNEITDFIEMNPVGKTVQWTAPMDISIRMVNMLLSYDILMQLDTEGYLDKEFQDYFEKHINRSLQFVMDHLEYIDKVSTNHYLSNIAGIIFAAAYLPRSRWVDACMVFGTQELIEQVKVQFYKEGSHFEGSTSYHRLSTEFVLYSVALIYGVLGTEKRNVFLNYDSSVIKRLKNPKSQKYSLDRAEFFPEWFTDRLCNAGIFTKICLKHNDEIVQIGDNDSGRLLKLTPIIDTDDEYMEDNVLDHNTLISAMCGIFANEEFIESAKKYPLESSLVKTLSKNTQKRSNIYISYFIKNKDIKDIREKYKYSKKTILFQDNGGDLLKGIEIHYFEKFGIVVLKGDRLFVSMVIDTAQNAVFLGHTHNDKLSIEVMVDGKYITRDSGGYIYTAAPKIRDKFRSIKAHNTICVEDQEQNSFDGIWGMKKRARAELLYCADNRMVARVRYGDIECLRDISLTDNEIVVNDFANKPFKVAFCNKVYSDGYGKLKRVKK